MNRIESFSKFGWANILVAEETLRPVKIDDTDRGYTPPFRVAYCAPETNGLEAFFKRRWMELRVTP